MKIEEGNKLIAGNATFIVQSAFMDKAAGILNMNIRVQNEVLNLTKHCHFHLGEVSIDDNDKARGRGGEIRDNLYANLINIYKHDLINLGLNLITAQEVNERL